MIYCMWIDSSNNQDKINVSATRSMKKHTKIKIVWWKLAGSDGIPANSPVKNLKQKKKNTTNKEIRKTNILVSYRVGKSDDGRK